MAGANIKVDTPLGARLCIPMDCAAPNEVLPERCLLVADSDRASAVVTLNLVSELDSGLPSLGGRKRPMGASELARYRPILISSTSKT